MHYTNTALIPVMPSLPQKKHLCRTFQGIPSIACSPEGRLFCVWYAGGDSECRDNYVILFYSDDHAASWTPAAVVDPPDPDVRAYDSVLWFDPDGNFRWFWAQGCGGASGTWDVQDGAGGVIESIITNYTGTPEAFRFSAPRRISDGVMMNKPAVFSDGTWVYPVCVWSLSTVPHPDLDIRPGCRMSVSCDHGKTLTVRGHVDMTKMPCGADETEEQNFVERKDGSIVVWGRAGRGMGESVSHDGGKTWSDPCPPAGFVMTNSRMCIRRLPSGRLLQICNDPHGVLPEPYQQRDCLTARLSEDDGKSWTGGLVLDERQNVSYPDADVMPDGSICAIYDRERLKEGEILFARFTEEDVLAGKDVSGKLVRKRLIDRSGGVR